LFGLIEELKSDPQMGTPIGRHCFKIRLAIASKGKGKSGGARIITNFLFVDSAVFLLAIYDKSEKNNITDKELQERLQNIPQ
jgi:hypothetical protein